MPEKPKLDKVLYRPIVFRTFDVGRNSRDALKCLSESGSTFPIGQGRNWVLRKPRASQGHRNPSQSKNTEILITVDVWLWRAFLSGLQWWYMVCTILLKIHITQQPIWLEAGVLKENCSVHRVLLSFKFYWGKFQQFSEIYAWLIMS